MVTPLAQYVGSQAALNVLVGERYGQVSDQTIEYALGRHGGEEATSWMDPEVRAKILDRPRTREIEAVHRDQPSLAELRKRYGADISDEDLIMRVIVGDDAVEVVKKARATHVDQPLTTLIRNLSEGSRRASVYYQTNDVRLELRKRSDLAGTQSANA
jgi:oxaloacetate decarboxylase alpha subunit